MAGIVRIAIQSKNKKDWRFIMARELAPMADNLYRTIFNKLNMPLIEGSEDIECTIDEAKARYDWEEGIDCLLYFTNGVKATLQEKYLTYWKSTATFEESKNSGKPGAWYYCTAQYYFVGYARKYLHEKVLAFQDWIMIDLPNIHRKDATKNLNWQYNKNKKDGRRSPFRYLNFKDVPTDCIVARKGIESRRL